jgi:hemerythrin-like metal-binding protein
MMRQCGYPELAAHQEEHRRYMLRVERFKTDFEETNKEDTVAMLHILRDLILNHILRTDLAYSAYMNADGIR